jgi:transposase
MTIKFKPSPIEFNQSVLFPTNIFDLLSEDNDCYLFSELFEQLDTTALESEYSHIGQHAYHPKLIVSILIYAYSRGVFSSREIERRCNEDLSFMYIAQKNCPEELPRRIAQKNCPEELPRRIAQKNCPEELPKLSGAE